MSYIYFEKHAILTKTDEMPYFLRKVAIVRRIPQQRSSVNYNLTLGTLV